MRVGSYSVSGAREPEAFGYVRRGPTNPTRHRKRALEPLCPRPGLRIDVVVESQSEGCCFAVTPWPCWHPARTVKILPVNQTRPIRWRAIPRKSVSPYFGPKPVRLERTAGPCTCAVPKGGEHRILRAATKSKASSCFARQGTGTADLPAHGSGTARQRRTETHGPGDRLQSPGNGTIRTPWMKKKLSGGKRPPAGCWTPVSRVGASHAVVTRKESTTTIPRPASPEYSPGRVPVSWSARPAASQKAGKAPAGGRPTGTIRSSHRANRFLLAGHASTTAPAKVPGPADGSDRTTIPGLRFQRSRSLSGPETPTGFSRLSTLKLAIVGSKEEFVSTVGSIMHTALNSTASETWSRELLEVSGSARGNPASLLKFLREAEEPPLPGKGATAALWSCLSEVAAVDLAAARTIEPHLDAAAIFDQAGMDLPVGAWGVFAAEDPRSRVEATRESDGSYSLSGTKAWCSLAGQLDYALVTAHVPEGRQAFAVDLRVPGVRAQAGTWVSQGLAQIESGPLHLDRVPAVPVGDVDWYLRRAGFAWEGMGVASCWFGGATGLYRTLHAHLESRSPDQLALAWLGEADRLLAAARNSLDIAAAQVDANSCGWIQGHRLRGQLAHLGNRLLEICQAALGPAPLAFDEDHARRVADLTIYLRQHHASRDDAALGSLLLEEGNCSW